MSKPVLSTGIHSMVRRQAATCDSMAAHEVCRPNEVKRNEAAAVMYSVGALRLCMQLSDSTVIY